MKIIISLLLFFHLIHLSFAGPKVGNGGIAWKCTDRKGQTKWVKLLDLYEMQYEHDLTLDPKIRNLATKEEVIDLIKEKLDLSGYLYEINLDQALIEVKSRAFYTSSTLNLTNDFSYRVMPPSETCLDGNIENVQIANFTENDDLLIQSQLWEMLTVKEQAALLLHEAIYKILREDKKDQYSDKTRRIVGYIFSNFSTKDLAKSLNKEFEKNKTFHPQNLDHNILPFLLASSLLNERIEDSLNKYCNENSKISCDNNIYFRHKAITPGEVDVQGDHFNLTLNVKYNFIYKLNGHADTCVFEVTVVEKRFSGESLKEIKNIITKCSNKEDAL